MSPGVGGFSAVTKSAHEMRGPSFLLPGRRKRDINLVTRFCWSENTLVGSLPVC